MGRLLLLALGLTVVAACNNDPVQPQSVACDPFLLSFSTAPGDTAEIADGVKYIDVAVGSGEPVTVRQVVEVNYTLYTTDDDLRQDTSCGYRPLRAYLSDDRLLANFRAGIVGMQEDGIRRILIPGEAAYRDGRLADRDLTFDIQLLRVL